VENVDKVDKQETSPAPEKVPVLAQSRPSDELPLSLDNFDAERRQALLEAAKRTSGQYAPNLSVAPILIVPTTPPRLLTGPARLLVAALGLGGMVDALFYGQRAGIGVPLFALLALGALIGLALRENLRTNLRTILLTGVPLLFFTSMVAIRDNEFLTSLNILVSLFLAGLLAHFFAGGNLATLKISGFLGVPWLSFGNTIVGAAPAVQSILKNHPGRSEGRNKLVPLLRGLLLALPILAVLVPLLISADAVFAQQAERFFGWLFPENWDVRVGRLMIILGATWFIAGGFVYALTRQEREGIPQTEAGRPIGFTEGMTPLVLVCALFAGFLMVQAEYLFGGNARVQAIPGLTYAEYARRGFGELVTVAALTLSLALGWQRLMQREGITQIRLFKGSLTLLVSLTLVLLASAYQRMAAYEMAYGATETRLYVDAFIVFLGAVLIWFATTLWTETQRFFAFGGFLCVLAYVASLNLLNPDAAVARTNIVRSLAGKQKLDSYTLRNMSDDALPALCAALDKTTGEERNALASVLRLRLTQREEERKKVSWPSWNASREFGLRELRRRSSSLPSADQANRYSGECSCD
jgi:hypothetical protein